MRRRRDLAWVLVLLVAAALAARSHPAPPPCLRWTVATGPDLRNSATVAVTQDLVTLRVLREGQPPRVLQRTLTEPELKELKTKLPSVHLRDSTENREGFHTWVETSQGKAHFTGVGPL